MAILLLKNPIDCGIKPVYICFLKHLHTYIDDCKVNRWNRFLKNVVKYHVLLHNVKSIVFGQTIITTGICLYIIKVYKVRLSNYHCGLYEDGRWWFIFMYMHVMGVEHVQKHYLKVNINYWRGEIVRLKLISLTQHFCVLNEELITCTLSTEKRWNKTCSQENIVTF